MQLLEQISSKTDKTVKFIYRLFGNYITEVSYIDNGTGKDILCVGAQTGCHMRCKFCHATDMVDLLPVVNLSGCELRDLVVRTYGELGLSQDKLLLVSFMGCGEPLVNMYEIERSMHQIRHTFANCRFAVSTMFPKAYWPKFFNFVKEVQNSKLPVKLHLSLHFTRDDVRSNYMPAASPIQASLAALEFYKSMTGEPNEIHYTLMDGINDSLEDAEELARLLHGRSIPVKIIKYNPKKTTPETVSLNKDKFIERLTSLGITTEYYEPPGHDIGSSCGEFQLEYHQKYL